MSQLDTKAVQDDQDLKRWCLEVKGDVDGEIDTGAAVRDWSQVLAIAKSTGDRKLTARANGELAILAFLQGRIQDARPMMATAILEAKTLHDVGAEIRYLSASGTALALLRSNTESLQFFDQALALAKANPDIRDLVKASLRHRPDRILLGEVRGAEAFDLLQALNTGHSGTLATIHANSASQSVSRFTSCVLQSDVQLPFQAIRTGIAESVDLILHIERRHGQRVVSELVEVDGYDGANDRFRFRHRYRLGEPMEASHASTVAV